MEKKVILFGAGKIGKYCLDAFGSDAVFAFCDNFSSENQLNGKKIISFDELKQIYTDYNVILSVGGGTIDEISKQLEAAGIPYSVYARGMRKQQIACGEYHKIEDEGIFTDKFVEYLIKRKPRVFANLGAASGGYVSIASHFMGKDAEIYVFEPVPDFVRTLQYYFNGDNRIHIIEKAVSNQNGTMDLFATVKQNSSNIAHSFTMDKQQTMFNDEYTDECQTLIHTVNTIVLDDFFVKTDVDVMLIDIEGAEVLAIEGMEKLIKKRKTTFFFEIHEPYIQAIRSDGMKYINEVFKQNRYKIYWCELHKNGDYKKERGGVRLVPSDGIRWEHCIVSPDGLEDLL